MDKKIGKGSRGALFVSALSSQDAEQVNMLLVLYTRRAITLINEN